MTPEENIAAINAELAAARASKATHEGQRVANIARTQDWMRTYRGPGHSAEADTALASCAADKAVIDAQLIADNERIAQLTAQLDSAMKAKETQDAAHSQAIAEGLTGEAAIERAKGIVAAQKSRTIAIVIAATVLGLIALFWAWRKFMAKGKTKL